MTTEATEARGTGRYARQGEVLLLKTVNLDSRVEASDCDAELKYGLDGLVRGCGDGMLLPNAPESTWIVFAAQVGEVVEFEGKGKAASGRIVHCGTRERAVEILCEEYPDAPIVYRTAIAGDWNTATAGDWGTAIAGARGIAVAGYRGTATAGDGGTSIAGERGTAIAGDWNTATAGYGGSATVGAQGIATAGYGGTTAAGNGGVIQLAWWDDAAKRRRMATGYIGEDGLEPNVKYRLNDNHRFVKA